MESSKQIAPYPLRLRKDLREKLEIAAKAEGRTLQVEIVARIDDSFVPREASQTASEILAMLRSETRTTGMEVTYPVEVLRIAEAISKLQKSKIHAVAELLGVVLT
ncbi:Arc family DNA-binding protein [Janthinobacterium sp. CAN_S7]|uniref:Arc family DNA-binding protein n=1 Tax=Janthinobacterium sp. CAN_S7 TaxID=3071704 RepID=UPI00319DD395